MAEKEAVMERRLIDELTTGVSQWKSRWCARMRGKVRCTSWP